MEKVVKFLAAFNKEALNNVIQEAQKNINIVMGVLLGFIAFIFIIYMIWSSVQLGLAQDEEKRAKIKKYQKWLLAMFILIPILWALSPAFIEIYKTSQG